MIDSVGTPLLYAVFTAVVLGLLAIDLGVFQRKAHVMRMREAVTWSVVWIGLAVLFNVWIGWRFGPVKGLEFTTGYVIEKALSVDNVFIFLVIFSTFRVPDAQQHRVLFWGVLGALVLRGAFIAAGAAALHAFHGVIYVFGGILLLTGGRLLATRDHEEHPERNPAFRLLTRVIPSTPDYHGDHFWIRVGARRLATPLFLVLVLIEITDVIFAVDSIPAVFAVTKDPFLVFTSNVFAILGLRALYFCVAGFVSRLRHLKIGLALVLIFVALKMLLTDVVEVPIGVSLAVVGSILGGAVATSLLADRRGRT
ncbi:MAG: TerC family protein [Candidatus Eisenbacteria bacterium]